jgi:predicted O-methyltransferase YrrM
MEEHQHPPPRLGAILDRTVEISFPMASESRTGMLLRTLAASRPGGRLLEIGTGTGIATAWLLDGMDPAARLITVDVDARAQAVARDNLADDPRLEIVTDDAAAFLTRQPAHAFDLIFADAMIGKFELLEETLDLLRVGGIYVVDDLLRQPNWPAGHEVRVASLFDNLNRRRDLRVASLTWSSGIVIAAKIG